MIEPLIPQKRDVLKLALVGKSAADIAVILDLSPRIVEICLASSPWKIRSSAKRSD